MSLGVKCCFLINLSDCCHEMSPQLSKGMVYLRRRNEDLLAQLESNSIILEKKLKHLRETARTPRRSDKSWSNLPQSQLKRKYQSWKKRNNSCQVSAVFKPDTTAGESSNSDISGRNFRLNCIDEPTMKSPVKRSKKCTRVQPLNRKITIASSGRPVLRKTCRKEVQKKINPPRQKASSDCYCKTLQNPTGTRNKLRRNKVLPEYFELSSEDDSLSHQDSQRHILEEARSVLSYSPESIFLRRLKKRSQINLNEPNDSNSKPQKSRSSARKSTVSTKEKSRSKSVTETSPAENTRSRSQSSKHLCNSQRCNSPKDSKSSRKDTLKTTKSCVCDCQHHQPTGYDVLASLKDNSQKSKLLSGADEGEDWVDQLSEFRRSHWFDCHAFLPSHKKSKESFMTDQAMERADKNGHQCIHRYILNDRLFPTPLYSDKDARSRCLSCHLPSTVNTKELNQPLRPREQIQVTLPRQTMYLDQSKPSVGGFKVITNQPDRIVERKKSRPCMLQHPILSRPLISKPLKPTNSLALRYQKGMI